MMYRTTRRLLYIYICQSRDRSGHCPHRERSHRSCKFKKSLFLSQQVHKVFCSSCQCSIALASGKRKQ
jgi:hypothetical protein